MGFLRSDLMPSANAFGSVDEDGASLQIIPVSTRNAGLYLYVEKIDISVYKAAVGGNGILTIQTDTGDKVWSIDVDTVKDFHVDWGEAGIKTSDLVNEGLQAVLSGADTQASVSVGITAHYDRR